MECPMLVLSRCCDQEIVIDSNIRVRIGEVVGGRVKLLIEAPQECLVRREELLPAARAMAAAA
jgi:carbon storage regulator CsrA